MRIISAVVGSTFVAMILSACTGGFKPLKKSPFAMSSSSNFELINTGHPKLFTDQQALAAGKDPTAYNNMITQADLDLGKVIYPGYAGWDYRNALEFYARAYRITKTKDPLRADFYSKKALGLMRVLYLDNMYGGPESAELVGVGNGNTRQFNLSMPPLNPTQVQIYKADVQTVSFVYSSATPNKLSEFFRIVKISNSPNGNADYPVSNVDYQYRHNTLGNYVLVWKPGLPHPAEGATYYVSYTNSQTTVQTNTTYTITNSALNFNSAPSSTEAIYARYVSLNYEQSGNKMGGLNAIQPDGPGYPARVFMVGLAYGYDLLWDHPNFPAHLKKSYYTLLNQELDWYAANAYCANCPTNNYYTRGYLLPALYTALATADENPRAQELKALAKTLILATQAALKNLEGGSTQDGQYAGGSAADILGTFVLWRDLCGEDLITSLAWFNNLIPTTIHQVKPDQNTFYDGGDWSTLPASISTPKSIAQVFINLFPDHVMSSYARQFLVNLGESVVGPVKDYKRDFSVSYLAQTTGPLIARSDWDANAVWWSLAATTIFDSHQHRDQGHITLNRGTDYLIVNSGGYGLTETLPYHNTLGFDDGGVNSVYPPGQGYWAAAGSVGIQKFDDESDYTYAEADFTATYKAAHTNMGNSVVRARRSTVYLRPEILIVHDQALTATANVKKIFNINFGGPPVQNGNKFVIDKGSSRLFMSSLVPANPMPVLANITYDGISATNYQVSSTGTVADSFLHVFQATALSQANMSTHQYIKSLDGNAEGAELSVNGKSWVVLFAIQADQLQSPVSYVTSYLGAHRDVISDLQPLRDYRVEVKVGGVTTSSFVKKATDSGAISFSYTISESANIIVTGI